jgi:acyl-CoA thioester hydrolase
MNGSGSKHSFSVAFQAQWSDIDQNGHMRTHAFLVSAEDSRMQYFAAHGYPVREFTRCGLGPVIQRDDLQYLAELRLMATADIGLRLAGVSADGARFRMRNTFTRDDGTVACVVTSTGGWLDLATRHLTTPPGDLHSLLANLARTDDFQELPSLRKA